MQGVFHRRCLFLFWQTGVLGTVAYMFALDVIMKRCLAVEKFDCYAYVGGWFVFTYLLISSITEPAFHNSVAIPLAMMIGIIFAHQTGAVSEKKV